MYIKNDVLDFIEMRSNNLNIKNIYLKINNKNYKALRGSKNMYTVRISKYRLILLIENSFVYIMHIGNRDHVYGSVDYDSEKNKIKDKNYLYKKYKKKN